MKFITESYLRNLYKKEPFTVYEVGQGARLTPGGRQYLTDRGIKFQDSSVKKVKEETEKQAEEAQAFKTDWKKLLFQSRMKSIEALFLLTCEELLSKDVDLAHAVVKIYKQFSSLNHAVKTYGTLENFPCTECAGIKESNFSSNLGDCFEITDFHMQLEKGREILLLHRLRCALQEMELSLQELLYSSKEEKEWYKDMIDKVNQLINRLSQLIHLTAGGNKCLRKG